MNWFRHTTEQFVNKALQLHGDVYDYSLVEYRGWSAGVSIVCRKHGAFIQKPTIHLEGKGCPRCGRERQMVGLGMEAEISRRYPNGESSIQIENSTGIDRNTVLRILRRASVGRRGCGRRAIYRVDHNYFSEINTPEKAYWLGWMASDGFVVHDERNHFIGLGVQERDREILDAFKAALTAGHPIRPTKKAMELRIVSRQLVEDLEHLGIVANKSLVLRCPEIDEGLRWDFFRGMFDGDGCVGQRSISLCGTKDIVDAFAELCRKSGYGLRVYKHSRGSNTWYAVASGKNARGILKMLYRGPTWLSRKRAKAMAWIDKMRSRDDGRLAA